MPLAEDSTKSFTERIIHSSSKEHRRSVSPKLQFLRRLYYADITPELVNYTNQELIGMISRLIELATYFDSEDEHIDPNMREGDLCKLKKNVLEKFLEVDLDTVSDGYVDAIARAHEGVSAGEVKLLISAKIDGDSHYSRYPKTIRVHPFCTYGTASDVLAHECGHYATSDGKHRIAYYWAGGYRDKLHELFRDELRQIMREPSIRTPEQAWDLLEFLFNRPAKQSLQPDKTYIELVPLPEDFNAEQKIAFIYKLAEKMSYVSHQELADHPDYQKLIDETRREIRKPFSERALSSLSSAYKLMPPAFR